MREETKTIKIWRSTLSKLRLIAGMEEVPMVKILDKLVSEELKFITKIELEKSGQKNNHQRPESRGA